MDIALLANKVEKKLLKRQLTASELGARVGGYTGRGISRTLGFLVREGRAVKTPGRIPTYTKAS